MVPIKVAIFSEIRKQNKKFANVDDDELNQTLFVNASGLRLTFPGFLILKNIFTVYSFDMDITITAKHQIGMASMMFPYYINPKRLILFSEMDAVVIKLQGGVKGFLETCFNTSR